MLDWGFKISQDGFDVKTCDDKDLVMSSKFDMLKTAFTGLKSPAGTIAHGLSYTPIFFTTSPMVDVGKNSFIGDDFSAMDATNLTTFNNNTRYYIFYQQF